MLSARIYLSFVAASLTTVSALVVACSSDATNPATTPNVDAGPGSDAGNTTTPTGDGGAPGVPVQANGATLFTLDVNLPFTAKNVYAASGRVLDAHWGNHGGPMVTYADNTTPSTVTRYTVSGTAITAAPDITSANPTGLPAMYFWTAEGFVDMPFDDIAIASYSTTGDQSNGEAFIYSQNYDTVVGRAFVNGLYAARGVTDGTKTRLVYTGESDLSDTASTTSDNGVWAADITASSLTDGPASLKLFGWSGFSGPIVTDNDGNVFAAAAVSGGAHSDEIYAISQSQALGAAAVTQATIADADTKGTDSLAVAEVKGSGKGWVFAKGYDASTPASVYAHAYTVANGTVASSGDTIAVAIAPSGKNAVSVFGSPDGNLWVAVKGDSANWFVELAPKGP